MSRTWESIFSLLNKHLEISEENLRDSVINVNQQEFDDLFDFNKNSEILPKIFKNMNYPLNKFSRAYFFKSLLRYIDKIGKPCLISDINIQNLKKKTKEMLKESYILIGSELVEVLLKNDLLEIPKSKRKNQLSYEPAILTIKDNTFEIVSKQILPNIFLEQEGKNTTINSNYYITGEKKDFTVFNKILKTKFKLNNNFLLIFASILHEILSLNIENLLKHHLKFLSEIYRINFVQLKNNVKSDIFLEILQMR